MSMLLEITYTLPMASIAGLQLFAIVMVIKVAKRILNFQLRAHNATSDSCDRQML